MNATVQEINATFAPHSIEAEQMVLGALLLGRSTDVVQQAGGIQLFFDPVHAGIYRICRKLESADQPVSPVTVAQMVGDDLHEGLAELGGRGYLARLAGAAIAPSQIGGYVQLLAEDAAKRALLDVMREAQGDLARGELGAGEIAGKIEAGLSHMETQQRRLQPTSMMAAITQGLDEAYRAHEGEELAGIKPGIPALDKLVPVFGPGELWLLGGRPSMGKTACALSLATAAARDGHPVVFCSFEMLPSALAQRALSEETARMNVATSYRQMRMGDFSPKQGEIMQEAARSVAQLPLQFLPREYRSCDLIKVGVKQALRAMTEEGGPTPLIVVDYAQLMTSRARDRYQQITEVSLTLKAMAMDLEVPVIALSQLSRAVESREDKRPMMSDLRESGQLEQDADGVMFCFREEYYLQRAEPDPSDLDAHTSWQSSMERARNRLEIIVAKQRQGETGTARMHFNPAINRIWE